MKFSVIIPLYNKAPYVAKAIKSVLAQSFTDYELVIMDDGSQDDSFEIAVNAVQGCGKCHIYRQKNSGVSMARNNAVAISQGRYLCFLDADDWWAPTFLEKMSSLIDEFPEAGIYGSNYTIVNETRHKTRVASVGVDKGFEKGYINYCQVYAKTMYMPLWTGAVCMPRVVFEEMRGFPKGIKLGEDFMLWVRIALKYKVVFLNESLSYYNQDADLHHRGVGILNDPKYHMLWNLMELEDVEKTDADFKALIDKLRLFHMYPYLLEREYRELALQELVKVDWRKQPLKYRIKYHLPAPFLRIGRIVVDMGHKLKNRTN